MELKTPKSPGLHAQNGNSMIINARHFQLRDPQSCAALGHSNLCMKQEGAHPKPEQTTTQSDKWGFRADCSARRTMRASESRFDAHVWMPNGLIPRNACTCACSQSRRLDKPKVRKPDRRLRLHCLGFTSQIIFIISLAAACLPTYPAI